MVRVETTGMSHYGMALRIACGLAVPVPGTDADAALRAAETDAHRRQPPGIAMISTFPHKHSIPP